MNHARIIALVGAIGGSACTDLDIVPPDAQLLCGSDDDCPDGFACRLAIGRCLPSGLAQTAPIAVVTPIGLNADRRSRATGFSVLEATATFSITPVGVDALFDDRVPLDCTIAAGSVACSLDLATVDSLVDGDVDVEIAADDGLGTVAVTRARVAIDLTAPDIAGAVVVAYEPDADNVLDVPAALGPHVDAVVRFSLTEVPGSPPTAALADGTRLAFDPGLTFGLEAGLIVDGATGFSLPDGDADVDVTLIDDVGNARTLTLTGLVRIDQTAPAPAAVDVSDAVVYARIPEGSRVTAGVPRFTLAVDRGVEPDARVVVTTEATFSSIVLGAGRADATGSLSLGLAPVDLSRVFVHVVDDAGNVSASARVRDIVWTASVAGRRPGDPRSNPHALFGASSFDGASLLPHLQTEIDSGDALVTGGSVVVNARGAFVQDPLVGAGTPRTSGASLVWHAARGEILAFGGTAPDAIGFTSRLLRLDGDRWVEVAVDGALPPPASGTAVYDPAHERLVLVQESGQTWFFEDGRWRQHDGATPSPGSGASVAWDEGRRGIVRFGGRQTSGAVLAETWFFDGQAWQLLSLSSTPPSRHQAAMAFDRVDGCLLVRGGRGEGFALLHDLWCLGPDDWRLVAAGQAAPAPDVENPSGSFPYASGVAVTDPDSGRVQFIGGTGGGQTLSNTVVTFDGTRLRSGPAFSGAVLPAAAWDLARGRLVSLGGSNFNLGNNTLVRFVVLENGVERAPPVNRTSPGQAEDARIAYDAINDVVVMFAGLISLSPGGIALTSTRAWDGENSRTLVGNVGTGPFGGIFFDGANIGGVTAGTVFQLDDNAWVAAQALPAGAPSSSVAFTYHAGLDAAFSFGGGIGGNDISDVTTTIRDGVVAILTPTTRPPARRSGQIAYDVAGDRVVLYGGFGPNLLRDTWVFEGGEWRELPTSTSDVGDARLLYDDVRGVVVRLGEGRGSTPMVVDELRDDGWVRRDVAIPGPARVDFNAAFDVARQRTFVCGGFAGGTSRDEVFTWDGDVDTRPAALMTVDLRAREAGSHTVRAVEFLVRAGADGADRSGAAVHDVDVLVWGDAWERVGGHAAGVDNAADVTVSIAEADRLQRTLRDRLVVAVQGPASGAGPAARLQLEALEVTVRHREE